MSFPQGLVGGFATGLAKGRPCRAGQREPGAKKRHAVMGAYWSLGDHNRLRTFAVSCWVLRPWRTFAAELVGAANDSRPLMARRLAS